MNDKGREIVILNEAPVIFTKDAEFVTRHQDQWKLKPGAIIVLPEDAVLYEPSTIVELKDTNKRGE